jgi:cell division protease FtsH
MLGLRTFGEKEEMVFLGREIHEQRDYSEKTAELIDQEISQLIAKATKMAQEIVKERRKKIIEIASTLISKETIEKEEFEKLAGPKPPNQA